MKGPIVIIDAASTVGSSIVETALQQQWPTIAVSADAAQSKALRERHPNEDLVTLVGSIADEAGSAALAAALRELDRPIAGVVIACGGDPVRGRLCDHPAAELVRRIEADLLPQIAAARHLLPLLAASGRNGSYVVVGSPGGEHPWAGYGCHSVGAAAVNMLVRVLHDEARAFGVRVQLLALSRPVRTDENRACACDGWPTAAATAEQALALIEQTEPRRTADAIVRLSPPRAAAGVQRANDSAPKPTMAAAASRIESDSQRVLDQTWNALAPIFNSIREGDERK